MIDSSGRRFLRANGTIFDLLPVGQVLSVIGALLVVLFVLVRPEASYGLSGAGRLLFWFLHVGVGLASLAVASAALARRTQLPGGTLGAIILSGLLGIAIASPAYLALDAAFAPYVIDRDAEPAAASWPAALVAEAINLAPWFLATWLLINLPILLPRPNADPRIDDAAVPLDASPAEPPPELRLIADSSQPTAVARTPTPQVDMAGRRFLATLPGIAGKDVVAIASDLHYLNVWTVGGRTTVLGKLRDVVEDLGDTGMQVHRSHWVAHAHVRRIVGTGGDAACILSNELRVPISRRRWKAVREYYGRGVVHADDLYHQDAADK